MCKFLSINNADLSFISKWIKCWCLDLSGNLCGYNWMLFKLAHNQSQDISAVLSFQPSDPLLTPLPPHFPVFCIMINTLTGLGNRHPSLKVLLWLLFCSLNHSMLLNLSMGIWNIRCQSLVKLPRLAGPRHYCQKFVYLRHCFKISWQFSDDSGLIGTSWYPAYGMVSWKYWIW